MKTMKKNLAVATMAASLGVSLGVPVGDVLAAGPETMKAAPPGLSRQVKAPVSNQAKQVKGEAVSEQVKAPASPQSRQIKIGAESIQDKH